MLTSSPPVWEQHWTAEVICTEEDKQCNFKGEYISQETPGSNLGYLPSERQIYAREKKLPPNI